MVVGGILRRLFGAPAKSEAETFEGAAAQRRLAGWMPSGIGPRSQSYGIVSLRLRARDLYRNNAIARAAVDRLVADLVAGGVGCRPHSALPDRLRARMVTLWEDWARDADFDAVTDWYGLQAAAVRAMIIDGEALLVLEQEDTPSGVPLRLRLIEADHLPIGETTTEDGKRIVDGIELDALGRRVAYHILRQHPGEASRSGMDTVRVPADRVAHMFLARRPGQLRGESWLAPVLVRLRNLDEFDDAVLERQKLANLFLAFIRKPAPDPVLTTDQDTPPPPPDPIKLEPGTMQELLPGEDVEFAQPPAAEGYEMFAREQLRRIASALGVPYHLISDDYAQINDRTARVAITAYRRQVLQWTHSLLVPRLVRPVREAWVRSAVLAGMLPSNRALADLMRTHYVPEAWAYIHPVQDVQADALAIKAGLKSRAQVLLERGQDIEEVDAQRAADAEREQRLGLDSAVRDVLPDAAE
jgi:lambda family phage portal protein